jgi:hypothetical protein
MWQMMRRITLAGAVLGFLAAAIAAEDTVAAKIVKYCKERVGQQIGRGECADLAIEALRQAEAKLPNDFTDTPNAGDYVWGDLVYLHVKNPGGKDERSGALKDIQAGDIMQFRDAKLAGNNGPNGRPYIRQSPHHTAIVAEVKENGKLLIVFEQHVGDKREVMKTPYRLSDLREGWVRLYRPLAK